MSDVFRNYIFIYYRNNPKHQKKHKLKKIKNKT